MKRVALITGASTGIGKEFARVHAAEGGDVVLVARSEEKLQKLKEELETDFGIDARSIPMDLSDPSCAESLYQQLSEERIEVEYLINNAGMGELGRFEGMEAERLSTTIRLNIEILTLLTHRFAPNMLEKGKGRILNVASTAAFQPGPGMAVYYASKSYVLSFSKALAYEWRKKGVSVTVLCPGPTESEFQERSGMQGVPLFESLKPHSSRSVAEKGYRAMMKGKRIVIPGLMNKIGAYTAPLMPDGLVLRMVEKLQPLDPKDRKA